MRESCLATTSDARSAEIISACTFVFHYSAERRDRAMAAAIICHHNTQMRLFDLAEENCSKSFEYGIPTAYGHFVRGNLRLALRDFEGALKDFEAAAALKALSSTDAAAMAKKFAQAKAGADEINRKKAAETRAEREKVEREPATGEQAKKSNKNHQQVPDDLGSPDSAYDDRRCATAGESLHRVRACLVRELRKSPSDPDLMIRLANIHSEAGNHAEAVKIWSKLIAEFPNLVEFRQARCHEWILWGRQRQAAQHNCSTVIGQGAAE
jgi:tetratricopeptide (TPR) repeat protein